MPIQVVVGSRDKRGRLRLPYMHMHMHEHGLSVVG